jgi:hypothetical protein
MHSPVVCATAMNMPNAPGRCTSGKTPPPALADGGAAPGFSGVSAHSSACGKNRRAPLAAGSKAMPSARSTSHSARTPIELPRRSLARARRCASAGQWTGHSQVKMASNHNLPSPPRGWAGSGSMD